MKKLILSALLLSATIGFAQEEKPTYEAQGDLVKATWFHKNGSVKKTGFFKNKKLTGEWTLYDVYGKKTQTAFYDNGKKTGTWFLWKNDVLKQINYQDNTLVSVDVWKSERKIIASN